MKYLSLLLLFLTISTKSFSQDEFPKYAIDSSGQKVVEFTIQQAQRIDNDLDLLEQMDKMQLGCDTVIKTYKIVVSDMGKVIATQEVKIGQLESLNKKNTEIIDNLNEQIKKHQEEMLVCYDLNKNKDREITLKNRELLKLKVQKIAGFTVAGGITAAVIVGLVYGFVSGHLVIK